MRNERGTLAVFFTNHIGNAICEVEVVEEIIVRAYYKMLTIRREFHVLNPFFDSLVRGAFLSRVQLLVKCDLSIFIDSESVVCRANSDDLSGRIRMETTRTAPVSLVNISCSSVFRHGVARCVYRQL